jgi:Icc protein
VPPELTTLADDEIVVWDGPDISRRDGLEPGTEHTVGGVSARTLDRPPGERLTTFATVNDVHFGETTAGLVDGVDLDGALSAAPGDDPYPVVMGRAAVTEIAAARPDAVVAKGDLTCRGTAAEFAQFLSVYGDLPLTWVRGNHDHPDVPAPPPVQAVVLPGITLAILDTSRPGHTGGQLDEAQIDWLDDLAAGADQPVMVLGHHPPWSERLQLVFGTVEGTGLDRPSLDRLAAVVARRPRIVAYLAGHTHRNKLRRLPPTGPFPWIEVGCAKDFPGSWAEYRVFEGGILQVHRRISADPAAVAWSERCRSLYAGLYPTYAFGQIEDRCFEIPLRD